MGDISRSDRGKPCPCRCSIRKGDPCGHPRFKTSPVRFFSGLRLSALAAAVVGFVKPKGREAGLVMIQIDGLSRCQLERALKNGKMPFLSSFMTKQKYPLKSFYSGLPSSTAAVQAEIFYGVKCAVPSYGFKHRASGEVWTMLGSKGSSWVQNHLKNHNESILKGGSAYSDTYNEGTLCSGFCSPDMSVRSYLHPFNPIAACLLFIIHLPTIIKSAALLLIEIIIAVFDIIRGVIHRESFLMELSFITARVGICVILREVITSGVSIDSNRGLPLIHCNFLGYDEQAHRRGPSSKFAHWTLKGIDDSIERICKAASRSKRRDYQVWIYSDHGQETTIPYYRVAKTSAEKSIRGLFKQMDNDAHVVALGPVGHVYLSKPYTKEYLQTAAALLVEKCFVPLVMMKFDDDKGNRKVKEIKAWTRRGVFILPSQAKEILGDDHPFLKEAGVDLTALVHHEDSGDLVICGWDKEGHSMSFPIENGAHAGPGSEETHGFYLMPSASSNMSKNYLRPLDLRDAVSSFFKTQHSPGSAEKE
ncbi:MAG: alkaline phosphatase family protein [Chitinispirillia bacterium]|nr:alkaline phosphatase family protein [Chitinispirillia bacterium]